MFEVINISDNIRDSKVLHLPTLAIKPLEKVLLNYHGIPIWKLSLHGTNEHRYGIFKTLSKCMGKAKLSMIYV